MHSMDWSDLQYILAVAKHGSLAAAARRLGVNHSTVQRRITSFEIAHQVRLFDRRPDGYKLTMEGEQLLEAALAVEQAVLGLQRKIDGKDLRLEGTIRITTTDTLLYSVLGLHLAKFRKLYPDIRLEVAITNSVLSITKRDADVAIRPSQDKPDQLVGERVAEIGFGIYASPDYWQASRGRPLSELDWLVPDDSLANTTPGRWIRNNVAPSRGVFTADSFFALSNAAERGLGVAMLPCYLGDGQEGLVRNRGPMEPCSNGLWLVTHQDLAGSARIRTFMQFMAQALQAEQGRISGQPG